MGAKPGGTLRPTKRSFFPVFSAREGRHYQVFTARRDNLAAAEQLTHGEHNSIAPFFSEDGRYIYFSADDREAYNICGIDRTTRMRVRRSTSTRASPRCR